MPAFSPRATGGSGFHTEWHRGRDNMLDRLSRVKEKHFVAQNGGMEWDELGKEVGMAEGRPPLLYPNPLPGFKQPALY